jgi:hypothetical protein
LVVLSGHLKWVVHSDYEYIGGIGDIGDIEDVFILLTYVAISFINKKAFS